MEASSCWPTRPRGAVAELQVDGQDVGVGEELVLADQGCTALGGAFFSEVLAPSDDFHVEGVAYRGDLRAQAAQAQDAEDFAVDADAYRGLPATASEGSLLLGYVAEHG